MFKKFASTVIITALACTLGEISAFASKTSNATVKDDPVTFPSEAPAKAEGKPNEQLKSKMLKLVADARAGKVAPRPKSQIQPAKGNNLSKRTKIAIGIGVAVIVVAVIVVNHVRNHLFDDFRPFDNRR